MKIIIQDTFLSSLYFLQKKYKGYKEVKYLSLQLNFIFFALEGGIEEMLIIKFLFAYRNFTKNEKHRQALLLQ